LTSLIFSTGLFSGSSSIPCFSPYAPSFTFNVTSLLYHLLSFFLKKITQAAKSDTPERDIWEKTMSFFNTLAQEINERKRQAELLTEQNTTFVEVVQGLDV